MRDAPFLTLVQLCHLYGIDVQAYDPVVQHLSMQGVTQVDSAFEVSAGADAIIILTEWPQFTELNWVLMV
ncbi:UDP-glucose/GDP-mannose dehydrogenase family, UDP binding domain [compost metagenome]